VGCTRFSRACANCEREECFRGPDHLAGIFPPAIALAGAGWAGAWAGGLGLAMQHPWFGGGSADSYSFFTRFSISSFGFS